MATVPNIIPCARSQRIVVGSDGTLFVLGDVSYEEAGAWSLHFVPDIGFSGSLTVMGRERGKGPSDDNIGFVPIPYRLISLNGVASDYRLASDTITTVALIQVPAAGLTVGILVGCQQGTAAAYNHPLAGCAAP